MPHGHTQVHETRHGNMTQTEFTGEDNEFEYKGYNILVFRNQLNYNILLLTIFQLY